MEDEEDKLVKLGTVTCVVILANGRVEIGCLLWKGTVKKIIYLFLPKYGSYEVLNFLVLMYPKLKKTS